ncbi:MAG TPA: hypothetical protein VFE62_19970 [Gemmataceae bacterium]|nr:hypothetical protein [Gemmataceae bacterium]
MNTRTLDDLAREMACKTLAVVAKVLREDEQLDAFKEFHHIAVSGLEAYAIHSERLRQRFEPSKN